MSAVGHDQKVGRIIVEAIAVDVVDMLTASKGPAETLLHDDAVLQLPTTTLIDFDMPVIKIAGASVLPSRSNRASSLGATLLEQLMALLEKFFGYDRRAARVVSEIPFEAAILPIFACWLSATTTT